MGLPSMSRRMTAKRLVTEIERYLTASRSMEDIERERTDFAVRLDPRTGITSEGRRTCLLCSHGMPDVGVLGPAGFICTGCMRIADRIEDHLGVPVIPRSMDVDEDDDLEAVLAVEPDDLLDWHTRVTATIAQCAEWDLRPDVSLREWQDWCERNGPSRARLFCELVYRLAPHLTEIDARLTDESWLDASTDEPGLHNAENQ